LFASFTVLRVKPIVVTVCSDARVQERFGIDGWKRRMESEKALSRLSVDPFGDWVELGLSDVGLTEEKVIERLLLSDPRVCDDAETVWAPMWEQDGHEDHNAVNQAAVKVFGDRCRFYATYRRGSARTRTEHEVFPEPDWPARKLRAMACYESQVNLPNTRAWFDDWSREWVAQ
jgi:LmbE family N-acetylglucosaminyl deacetylase